MGTFGTMEDALLTDILQWDVRSWKKALDHWERGIDWSKVSSALELGGEKGGLSLWLAQKGISVICSNLENSRQTAEPLHTKYKVNERIKYQDIDATDIPYKDQFDLIVFKSILGGIGRNDNFEIQRKVLREVHKALKPGGRLLFAENLKASSIHQKLRKKFVKWGDSWRYVSLDEMRTVLQDFSSFEIKTTGVLGTFGRTEKQRSLLSAGDRGFLNALSPDKWKYIAYGIATK